MIVKNEEDNLKDCLSSFGPVADEFVIVDTGSTDGTVSIAKENGAEVIESEWRDDFSYSRNISLDHAQGPWCMWVDADDRLPPSEVGKILKLKSEAPDRAFCFRVAIPMEGGFRSEFMQLRMFPFDERIRFKNPIHEEILSSLKRINYTVFNVMNIEIIHTGYADPEMKRKKADRNLRILMANLRQYESDPLFLSQIGDAYNILTDFKKATEYYEKAFRLPVSKDGHKELYDKIPVRLAQMWSDQEDYHQAMEWVDCALEINSESLQTFYLKAEISEKLGDLTQAVQYYEKAILTPEQVDSCLSFDTLLKAKAHIMLGRAERRLSHRERAKHWFLKALGKYPTVIDAYCELGDIFLEEGNLNEAVGYFGKALSLNRRYSSVPLEGMAEICRILNKPKQRDSFLKELATYFPDVAQMGQDEAQCSLC